MEGTKSNQAVARETLENLLTEQDLKQLGIGKTTRLWQLRKQGRLPYIKNGKRYLYSPAAVMQALENGEL